MASIILIGEDTTPTVAVEGDKAIIGVGTQRLIVNYGDDLDELITGLERARDKLHEGYRRFIENGGA